MAVRGRRPKPKFLHVVDGTYRHGRHDRRGVEAAGRPIPPTRCKAAIKMIFEARAARMPWLTAADSDKLFVYAALIWEFERDPTGMKAARLSQLRALGSELGGDLFSRERIGTGQPTGTKRNPYFKD